MKFVILKTTFNSCVKYTELGLNFPSTIFLSIKEVACIYLNTFYILKAIFIHIIWKLTLAWILVIIPVAFVDITIFLFH